MDIIILIIIMGVIAFVVAGILIYRNTRKEVKQVEQRREQHTAHEFAPGHAPVSRKVTLDAKPQHHKGEHRAIKVQAAPLPDAAGANPPHDTGIEGVIAVVVSPAVHFADSGEAVTAFEPPLDVLIEYTEADVKATTLDDKDFPKLSIAQAYREGTGWKWERMKTRVDPAAPGGRGTLHTKLHSLHPNAALFITRP